MTPGELFESSDLSWLERPDSEVESASVERKRWADKREVARQLSAFANGSGEGGLLVLGVEKNGTIVGVDDRAPDNLLAELSDSIDACRYEHRTAKASNGRTVLLFYVPSSPDRVICTSDGRAYQRRGHATIELRDTEKRELRFARGEESFEDFPAAEWKPELIDQDLLKSYLEARRHKNGLTLDLPDEEALRTRKLLVDTSRGLMLTNAGVLAFARNPITFIPGARLRLLRFDGVAEKFGAERNVTKDRWFEGPIPRIVASVREFIRTLVREFDYLGPNGLFVTEPEYPEAAWDEAIVNGLVHRSYSLSSETVFVRIFDDRMEIESPGNFPGPARERRSHPRNPNLMDALRYFELVRLTREGTRRMAEEMAKLDLPPPEFSEPEGVSVLVVLKNDLERRRRRQGAPDVRKKWREVIVLIEEPEIALYRQKGLEEWQQLVASGTRPPKDVLASAARVLMNQDLAENQRTPVTDHLVSFVGELPERELEALIGAFTQGQFHSTPELEGRVASLLRRSPDARDQLLRWLEACPPATEDPEGIPSRQVGLALRELHADLRQRQLPPRAHINRVLAVARKHAALPAAQHLFEDVTGKPLK